MEFMREARDTKKDLAIQTRFTKIGAAFSNLPFALASTYRSLMQWKVAMWNYKDALRVLALVCVSLFGTNVGIAQTADEKEMVRSVATSFFAAYQRKDVDALTALWNPKTPELATFTTDVRKTFADGIDMKSFEIRRITVEGTAATVGVKVELQATVLKSAEPAKGVGPLNRTLRLANEDGHWKVWQYEPSERELASKLLAAKTESDQSALLEAEPDLITVELVQALRKNVETLNQRRELSQALVALRLTRSIAERIGDEQNVAFAVNNLAIINLSRGEYQQALDFFEQHLSLEWVKRDRALTARTLNNIGVVHREQGNYARALGYFERSLAVSEALGEKGITGLALNNIGTIHGSQGNHAQALEYFQRALKLAQASDDKVTIANALNNIGITHYRQRDYPRALEYYQQSLALREQLNDKRGTALTLNNIGIIHREQGDYKRALEYYQQSLEIREKLEDQAGTAAVLNHIGIIHYLQGDYRQALQFSNRVLDIATRLASPEHLWRGYELAGRAHTSLKQFDEAEKALTNSINTIEKMRYLVGGGELARQRFFEDKLPPYTAMVELAFNRNRPVDALTYSELAKARTLLDVLRNGRIPINKAMSLEEQEKEHISNAELTTLNTQIYDERQRPKPNLERIAELEPRREKARMAHEAFLTSLYVKHPELKVQRGEAMPITAAEAAALLPDRSTAIVEFVVAEDKSYLIVLTGDHATPKITSVLNQDHRKAIV
jgi:tetratricopeptide (TPR) repeat protein